jgi:hypothetical protein
LVRQLTSWIRQNRVSGSRFFYDGSWKEGKFHGYGVMRRNDGF